MLDRSISFTVLGAGGFIGSALVASLESHGYRVHAVTRASLSALLSARRPSGHVIDCIGMTGNFRRRPLDTAEAHVGIVARCLATLSFDSFLLLSSTRVYANSANTNEESPLLCRPGNPSELYNVTKLAGEALCLANPCPEIRVARVSNVYGIGMPAETFLAQVLHEGYTTGRVVLQNGSASAKDYVALSAVVRLLPAIAVHGGSRLYNIAAGFNTSHAAIAERLRAVFGWRVDFTATAPTVRYPPIDTSRSDHEFGPTLSKLSADLATLLDMGHENQCLQSMKYEVV